MAETVSSNEEIYIIIYCLIVLVINIDYLRNFKNVKKGLGDISSDDELEINPGAVSLMFFVLLFNFFRRWLIYLLAVLITEDILVIIISSVLFVTGLYDSLFNYSLQKVKKSNVRLYLSIADILFISVFIIYLFF